MNICISSSYYQPTISSVICRLWPFSKLVQCKVVTLDLVPGDRAPLSKDDGVSIRLPERQRVAAKDVLFQNKMYGCSALVVGPTLVIGGVGFVPQGEEPGVALDRQ